MTLSFRHLMTMVGRSLQSPREGAAEILAVGIPRDAIWLSLAIVVVLSVILAELTALASAVANPDVLSGIFGNPLAIGILQFLVLMATIGAVYGIGRAMGGSGSIDETAIIVAWLQFIMVCVQVVQTAALIIMPPMAGLIGIVALVLFLW
ncbi:MAG: YIP1 family protein, partial [Pseudomonadota bacterium]